MSYFEHIPSAPFKYYDENAEEMKLTIQPIISNKKFRVSNAFRTSYVRGIVGTFNGLLSRFMFYGVNDENKQKRHHPKAQDHVFFSAEQFSNQTGLCESQCRNHIKTLKRIFEIRTERSTANSFMLSQRVDEFLHIFTYKKLNEFIEKYQISKKDQYALKQLYKWRVLRPSDDNMNREQRQEYNTFIKTKEHKRFIHHCMQNNVTPEMRIAKIEMEIELLSPKQVEQLQRVKKMVASGVKKLLNYFHWKLIDLQQFITLQLKFKKDKQAKKATQDKSSHINSESNTKETSQHEAATRVAQRKPVPNDITEIMAHWNNMFRGEDKIPNIATIDTKTYNAIYKQVKSYGKATIISCINKVTGLNSVSSGSYHMTFNKFMTKKTIDIILSANIEEDLIGVGTPWLANYMANIDGTQIIPHMALETIPQFNSKEESINWWNENKNA